VRRDSSEQRPTPTHGDERLELTPSGGSEDRESRGMNGWNRRLRVAEKIGSHGGMNSLTGALRGDRKIASLAEMADDPGLSGLVVDQSLRDAPCARTCRSKPFGAENGGGSRRSRSGS
jgi:hypothetical protein